jgi:hypothetical protein
MKITTVGIDLAKKVVQVHDVDEQGKAVLKKPLKRDQVASFFANLTSCVISIEACRSAHHWARKLEAFGHTVKPMAPQFVKQSTAMGICLGCCANWMVRENVSSPRCIRIKRSTWTIQCRPFPFVAR